MTGQKTHHGILIGELYQDWPYILIPNDRFHFSSSDSQRRGIHIFSCQINATIGRFAAERFDVRGNTIRDSFIFDSPDPPNYFKANINKSRHIADGNINMKLPARFRKHSPNPCDFFVTTLQIGTPKHDRHALTGVKSILYFLH